MNDALLIGCDAREISAVEDRVLERAGLEKSFVAANLSANIRCGAGLGSNERFVTVKLAFLQPSGRGVQVRLGSAGHPAPLLPLSVPLAPVAMVLALAVVVGLARLAFVIGTPPHHSNLAAVGPAPDVTGARARYLREGAHWITFTSASTAENWYALQLQPGDSIGTPLLK